MNLPENVILNTPNGRYTLVGRVSGALCTARPADTAAVMGGRAQRDDTGALVEYRPISADTLDGLHQAAAARGFRHVPDAGGPLGSFAE